jgi:hypothetical protein
MGNLYQWLFTAPGSTGEVFHFYVPWIIVCSLGVIVPFYYSVEGRKRFVKNHPIERHFLDKIMGWSVILALCGFLLMAMRYLVPDEFFAWRVWRYLWGVICLGVAGRYIYYLVRYYPKERAQYRREQVMKQYYPRPRARSRPAARRS